MIESVKAFISINGKAADNFVLFPHLMHSRQ